MATAPEAGGRDSPFDLTLTDEQRLTRETLQRFAADELAPAAREADTFAAPPAGLLDRAAGLGLTAVTVPEEHGGAGLPRSPVSSVLAAEDLARGDMALALAILAPLGFVHTLIDQGTDEQRARWLPRFARERFVPAGVAVAEPRLRFDPREPATRAERDGDGYVLTGVKSLVPLAEDAEVLLVVADLAGEGPQAFLVPGGSEGLTARREDTMGLAALVLGRVELDGCRVPAGALLGDGNFDCARLLELSGLGLCGAAVGTCQAVLEYVRDYANERVAFGEPISHRQAVAFTIADMATELDGMRLMTWRAASRAEAGMDFHREACLARLQCAEKAMTIATDGVQMLGGHGFTQEHPVELWYRQLRAVALLEGCFSA